MISNLSPRGFYDVNPLQLCEMKMEASMDCDEWAVKAVQLREAILQPTLLYVILRVSFELTVICVGDKQATNGRVADRCN